MSASRASLSVPASGSPRGLLGGVAPPYAHQGGAVLGSGEAPSTQTFRPASVSAVICAFNEERNLPRLLEALLSSQGPSFELVQVVCIASGCTDRTEEIVADFRRLDSRVQLIVQPERLGKAAALAEGLRAARGEVILVENADTVPAWGALEELFRPFRDPSVPLVCSHLVPAPAPATISDAVARTLWEVHDYISTLEPKAGEAFAFRRSELSVPDDVEDDDTFVGIASTSHGGPSAYARNAIVYNRVPQTLRELLQQRYRVNRQVFGLWRRTRMRSSTWTLTALVPALLAYHRAHPRRAFRMFLLGSLETVIRVLAIGASLLSDAQVRKWAPVESTKWAIDQVPP
ncbi:MAG: glycosyltransferase [Thermoplasmata archaeon]|nr:glycosyltransferase [Thermoplasmata archaeon]